MKSDKPKPNDSVGGAPSAPGRDVAIASNAENAGRVKFDDRGNAVWEWAVITGAFPTEVTTSHLKKLENPALALADDSPPPATGVLNPKGVAQGYSPYDSGLLVKKGAARQKDLRRLGEWLKQKKEIKSEDD